MVATWAAWATEIVEHWPPNPRDAVADQAALDDSVQKAAWSGTSIA
jgi:hypothetical protein